MRASSTSPNSSTKPTARQTNSRSQMSENRRAKKPRGRRGFRKSLERVIDRGGAGPIRREEHLRPG